MRSGQLRPGQANDNELSFAERIGKRCDGGDLEGVPPAVRRRSSEATRWRELHAEQGTTSSR
jgi:hypothetical protein